jgi:hypothetical protein
VLSIFRVIIYHIKTISWYRLEARKVARVSKTQMVITLTSWTRYLVNLEVFSWTSLKAQILEELVVPLPPELPLLLYQLKSKCKEASEVLFLDSQDSQWEVKTRHLDLLKVKEVDTQCSTHTKCINSKCCSKSTSSSSIISWHSPTQVLVPIMEEATSHKVNMEVERATSSS